MIGHNVVKTGVWLDTFRSHMLLDEIHERDQLIIELRKRNASLEKMLRHVVSRLEHDNKDMIKFLSSLKNIKMNDD